MFKLVGFRGGEPADRGFDRAFRRACATPVLGAEAVAHNPYWAKHSFKWDYGMLFLVGFFGQSLERARKPKFPH